MRVKESLRVFGGAVVVYMAIAACGASGGGSSGADDGGPAASSSSGASGSASSSAGGGGLLDAIADALTNPVKDAKAGPLPPLVATELCDKAFTYPGGAVGKAAIHAYPGKLVNDLAAIQVVDHSGSYTGTAEGVAYTGAAKANIVYLADGSVAAVCGGGSMTFILPQ